MVTSRTGTAKYLRNSARVKRQARADGLTHCPMPGCGTLLDWSTPYLPASAETDHIVEYRHGGTDDIEGLRVICRRCNLARNRTKPRPAAPKPADFPTSRAW